MKNEKRYVIVFDVKMVLCNNTRKVGSKLKKGIKTLAMWLIIGVIAIVLITSIMENRSSQITYSELITSIENGEIEKMVTRLKCIDQKAVENHVNGAVWAFDYDKMFCVLMENEICRKVCEKNKYNSWMNLIGQYCVSRT